VVERPRGQKKSKYSFCSHAVGSSPGAPPALVEGALVVAGLAGHRGRRQPAAGGYKSPMRGAARPAKSLARHSMRSEGAVCSAARSAIVHRTIRQAEADEAGRYQRALDEAGGAPRRRADRMGANEYFDSSDHVVVRPRGHCEERQM